MTAHLTTKAKKRSKAFTIIAWIIMAILIPMCSAWLIGRWVYWFDMLASQQLIIGWAAVVLGALLLSRKRWAVGMGCLLLAGLSFYPVIWARTWTLPTLDLAHKPDGVIRIVTINIYPRNEAWGTDLNTLFETQADIIVINEVSPELSRSFRNRGYLDSTPYPNWALRPWIDEISSPCFIISRWAMEEVDMPEHDEYAMLKLFRRIKHPSGDVIVGLVHPLSPRSIARWSAGNRIIESQAQSVFQIKAQTGLPMLIGADLNAGPAQVRSKTFQRAGLRMSKPLLWLDGSFPANSSVPAPFRVQLDDVWSIGNIAPVSWNMIPLSGSDHQAVVVDFRFTDD